MFLRLSLAKLAVGLFFCGQAAAHEFWIDPSEYQVESGGMVAADLRNGEEFRGSALGYFDTRIARFDLIQAGRVETVIGRMGDVPALQPTAADDGLLVIVHETAPSTLTYKTWEKFAAFARHKDFPDIRARHMARGLPEAGFVETYTRHVKALVAIGRGAGQDVQAGLVTEFVAQANPYTDDMSGGFPVRLFYNDAPRASAQVEVFDRADDGSVTVALLRTDNQGHVTVPVQSGHEYLLDAVVLRPAPQGGTPVWETLWAGLSFAVP